MAERRGMTWEQVREFALALPGVEESPSYGAPALKVKKRLMLRLREPGVLVVIPIDDMEKAFLMETQPDVFYITDHYRGYPAVLVRLSKVHPSELREMIERCWHALAPKKLLSEYDAARS
jgi:hypothetical protein